MREVAGELDVPMAQVALAGVLQRPGMGSLLLGASRPEQSESNRAALGLSFTPEQKARLDRVSALPGINPYFIFDLPPSMLFGSASVLPWRRA